MSIWLETRRKAGKIGGSVRSKRKAAAARANGKLGGRPVDPNSWRQRVLSWRFPVPGK